MSEAKYYVFNETDGVLAYPEALTREECDQYMAQWRTRFDKQGYYLTATGKEIPVAEVSLKRIPEGEL